MFSTLNSEELADQMAEIELYHMWMSDGTQLTDPACDRGPPSLVFLFPPSKFYPKFSVGTSSHL